jgi:hypothetical protein
VRDVDRERAIGGELELVGIEIDRADIGAAVRRLRHMN